MAATRAAMQAGKDNDDDVDEGLRRAFRKHRYKLVESTNALPSSTFFRNCCSEEVRKQFLSKVAYRRPSSSHYLEFTAAKEMERKPPLLNWCLDLIEETSKADYDASGDKWSRSAKRKEMVLPDMRYLIHLASPSDGSTSSERAKVGFSSFMITYEDGHEVLYLYEIHFTPENQGLGYGGPMMDLVEAIGREVGVEKTMLTVYKSNERAVKWYSKRGCVVDPYSPGPRTFRDGTVKEASYLILSKALRANPGAGGPFPKKDGG